MSPITFTIDLEDHLGVYALDGRWVQNTRRILAFCADRKVKATFFAVGQVADAAPELLRAIVAGGHEVALHSHRHVRLTDEDKTTYKANLAAAKKKFEDITGMPVYGFRAPQFSLTPASAWVVDVLKDLGFMYSSSVLPGKGAFSGFDGAPRTPFQWENGLIEMPVPVLGFEKGPSLPFLGGVYLRYLPLCVVRMLVQFMPPAALLWTYTHPYDVDDVEGFVRLDDGTPLWANMLLMCGRKGFLEKLEKLLDRHAGDTLIARAKALKDTPVLRR